MWSSISSILLNQGEQYHILDRQHIASQWGLQLIYRKHNSDPTPQRVKKEISLSGLNMY
jgi:hypothetical protein